MKEDLLDSKVIRKLTPDGTLFVIIDEDKTTHKPVAIRLSLGKAGSNLAAWAYALANVCTLALEKGATIEDLITLISNTNSDRVVYDTTTQIKSGPAGLAQALMAYNYDRAAEVEKEISKLTAGRARLYGRSAR